MRSPDGPPGRLVVTGASGYLGRHVLEHAHQAGWSVVAPPSARCDVRDRERVVALVTSARPDAVAHLAYRRDERDTIVDGSRNVAEAAAIAGARLVHLSTDVVFGGRPTPYGEDDEPHPIIDYGRYKLAAEHAVAAVHPGAVLVRTSILYGDIDLSPVQLDVAEVAAGRRTMAFFSDEVRCPAYVDDVARAVLRLAAMGGVSGPLHVAGPWPMSRAEFARRTAAALGYDPACLTTATIADSGQPRPATVVLDSSRAVALGLGVRDPREALAAIRPRSS